MENTYFVMVPVEGKSVRWPPEGKVRMRYKQIDHMAFGWVIADSPKNAVDRFISYSQDAPPEIAEEILSYASGPAKVGILTEIVEVEL